MATQGDRAWPLLSNPFLEKRRFGDSGQSLLTYPPSLLFSAKGRLESRSKKEVVPGTMTITIITSPLVFLPFPEGA